MQLLDLLLPAPHLASDWAQSCIYLFLQFSQPSVPNHHVAIHKLRFLVFPLCLLVFEIFMLLKLLPQSQSLISNSPGHRASFQILPTAGILSYFGWPLCNVAALTPVQKKSFGKGHWLLFRSLVRALPSSDSNDSFGNTLNHCTCRNCCQTTWDWKPNSNVGRQIDKKVLEIFSVSLLRDRIFFSYLWQVL